jgi:FRG domain-containing protein
MEGSHSYAPAPDWYEAFKAWTEEPSPAGEWVYRGQAARYRSVLPSFLRDPHRKLYRNRLYDIDYEVARSLFSTSPVFHEGGLYGDVISDNLGLVQERLGFDLLGGPPSTHPRLSFYEIVRALSQHYGYPTLFIDVSLDPIVGAFFATYDCNNGQYTVRRDEPSVVYRWPAIRVSRSRLRIPHGGNADDDDVINVCDISNINRFMMRPRNQRAALATPVYDPRPLYQPFRSPADRLEVVNMSELPCCERFDLPPGAGSVLTELQRVNPQALFPDRIDLGYSYVLVIALLSLAVHHPNATEPRPSDDRHADNLSRHYRDGLAAGRAILDRECLRLVEGCPLPTSLHSQTLAEASAALEHCIETALEASRLMGSEASQAHREVWRKAREAAINAEAERRCKAWNEAVVQTLAPDRIHPSDLGTVPRYEITFDDNLEWIIPELTKRGQQVRRIIEDAAMVPAYALAAPKRYRGIIDAMPSDPGYENEVNHLIAMRQLWISDEPLFPRFA